MLFNSLIMRPCMLRLRNAHTYLGMDRNRFNTDALREDQLQISTSNSRLLKDSSKRWHVDLLLFFPQRECYSIQNVLV